jgi:hypothetical protein
MKDFSEFESMVGVAFSAEQTERFAKETFDLLYDIGLKPDSEHQVYAAELARRQTMMLLGLYHSWLIGQLSS